MFGYNWRDAWTVLSTLALCFFVASLPLLLVAGAYLLVHGRLP